MAGVRDTSRKMKEAHRAYLRRNNVCHLCGHPGADAVDHIIPIAKGGGDGWDNKAPAHHTTPCPTCGERCNRRKSDNLIAPVMPRSSSLKRDDQKP